MLATGPRAPKSTVTVSYTKKKLTFLFFKQTSAVQGVVSSLVLIEATGPKALQSIITVNYDRKKFTFVFFEETSAVHKCPVVLMKATSLNAL